MIAVVLALVTACAGHPRPPALRRRQRRSATKSASCSAPACHSRCRPAGIIVGVEAATRSAERPLTFVEPHTPARPASHLGPRTLATTVWSALAGSHPVAGPLPLIVFAPGFMLCSGPSRRSCSPRPARLRGRGRELPAHHCPWVACLETQTWSTSPGTSPTSSPSCSALSTEPNDLFSGLLDRTRIAAPSHSDAATPSHARGQRLLHRSPGESRRRALGADGPRCPDGYFPQGGPAALRRYCSHRAAPTRSTRQRRAWNCTFRPTGGPVLPRPARRGPHDAVHRSPFGTAAGAHVTLAFFNRYVLGQTGALATMTREGDVNGTASW